MEKLFIVKIINAHVKFLILHVFLIYNVIIIYKKYGNTSLKMNGNLKII